MRYIIKEGKHSSGIHIRPCINTHNMERTVIFNSSASYMFGDENDFDINKLFGFSRGMHKDNSARFGWRYNQEKKAIDIFAYVYRDGKLIMEWDQDIHICTVKFNQRIEMRLSLYHGGYIFQVNDGSVKYSKIVYRGSILPLWGYYLYPYFGGNKTAPHDITIDIYR